MQKGALVGAIIAAVVAASILPAYALAQRNAIASLEFDFDRFELTDIDFSETNSFGSMQRIVANAESPSLSMLSDFQSIQSSVSSPQAFALDILANTRLVYSMFIQVRNPSFIEAVIDRADVQALINGRPISTPVTIQHKQTIPAGGQTTIELQGIGVNGKDIAAILTNVASSDFILTFDLVIGSYFPTLFGDVQIPAYANLQMYLIPPKPTFTTFEDPTRSGISTVSANGRDFDYKLSIANNNGIPLSGKLEVGVMKGNFLSGIGLCDPACIAPIDNGFATFLRIKGSSLFGTQLFSFENIGLAAGEDYVATVTNPELRSNANSAFIIRWAPDYSKIPYVMTTDIQGNQKTVSGEYESTSFSTVRKIVYNVVRDFGYVGSQEFVSPDKSTSLTLSVASSENDGKTFSGVLRDNYGNTISNALITLKDNDIIFDDYMASGYTDSNGRYSMYWTPTKNDLDDVADAYAIFDGTSSYDGSTSSQLEVSTTLKITTTSISLDASSTSAYVGDPVTFTGRLVDGNGDGLANSLVAIYDDDPIGDDFMDSGYTDTNGDYVIVWTSTFNDPDHVADSKAIYDGDATHSKAVSSQVQVTVNDRPQQSPTPQEQFQSTTITLQVSTTTPSEGDTVFISGTLFSESGEGVPGATIYIKDEDSFSGDDVIANIATDSSGNYNFEWIAQPTDPLDNVAEVYAVFEGSSVYGESRSIRINVHVS